MRGVRKFALLLLSRCCWRAVSSPAAAAIRATRPPPRRRRATRGIRRPGTSYRRTAGPATTLPLRDDGSASFRTPGGDNSIQNFGEEADAAEVDEASATLSGYMEARAKDDWAKQCTLLAQDRGGAARTARHPLAPVQGQGLRGDPRGAAGTAPASTRTNTLTDGIASLRFEDDRGFALYHGTGGVDYFVPMVKEDGQWKIGAFAPSEFP